MKGIFKDIRMSVGLLFGAVAVLCLSLVAVGVVAGVVFTAKYGYAPCDAVNFAIWHCRIIIGGIIEAWETLFK